MYPSQYPAVVAVPMPDRGAARPCRPLTGYAHGTWPRRRALNATCTTVTTPYLCRTYGVVAMRMVCAAIAHLALAAPPTPPRPLRHGTDAAVTLRTSVRAPPHIAVPRTRTLTPAYFMMTAHLPHRAKDATSPAPVCMSHRRAMASAVRGTAWFAPVGSTGSAAARRLCWFV